MTENEQQLQNYAAMIEKLNRENAELAKTLGFAREDLRRKEGRILAMGEVIDAFVEKLIDRKRD